MISDIVLIGPMQVGKSTQGQLLAKKLGIPQASLDAVGWKYYTEAGLDRDEILNLLHLSSPATAA